MNRRKNLVNFCGVWVVQFDLEFKGKSLWRRLQYADKSSSKLSIDGATQLCRDKASETKTGMSG
jgi:hypothetical protein